MKGIKVSLTNINDISKFNKAVSKFDYDVDVSSGRYLVNAKSLMGLYSLDLSKPIEILVDAENYDEIYGLVKDWIAK